MNTLEPWNSHLYVYNAAQFHKHYIFYITTHMHACKYYLACMKGPLSSVKQTLEEWDEMGGLLWAILQHWKAGG